MADFDDINDDLTDDADDFDLDGDGNPDAIILPDDEELERRKRRDAGLPVDGFDELDEEAGEDAALLDDDEDDFDGEDDDNEEW